MNFIKKIISVIKSFFIKENDSKVLEEQKIVNSNDKKNEFVYSIKISNSSEKDEAETFTCIGDGLGIQDKITY